MNCRDNTAGYKIFLERVPLDKALEGRTAQESLLPPPSSGAVHLTEQEVRQKHQDACTDDQGALGQTQTQKKKHTGVESRTDNLGENTEMLPEHAVIRLGKPKHKCS